MSMLYAKADRARRSIGSKVPLFTPRAIKIEFEQIRKEGREDWSKHRQQKGSQETLEELRTQGREDWLKLRQQQTREKSRDPPDRSAEKDQNAKPDDVSGSLEKGLNDDLS
jgi:hypothetical protein